MRKSVLKIMSGIDNVFITVSAVFLLGATILAVMNAILRFADLGGITWAEEMSTILMILLVYLAQPQLEFRKKQLSIAILNNLLKSDRSKRILNIIHGVVTIAITGYILFYVFKVLENAVRFNYITSVLQIPRKFLFGFVLVAYIFVILSWIVTIFCNAGKVYGDAQDAAGISDHANDHDGGDA